MGQTAKILSKICPIEVMSLNETLHRTSKVTEDIMQVETCDIKFYFKIHKVIFCRSVSFINKIERIMRTHSSCIKWLICSN